METIKSFFIVLSDECYVMTDVSTWGKAHVIRNSLKLSQNNYVEQSFFLVYYPSPPKKKCL